MTTFSKEQEQYIEHEVKLRFHDDKFKTLEKSIDKLDSKFTWMFGILLGSIWLPAVLHYLHLS